MSAVLVACTQCPLVLRVMGTDAEVELLVGPGAEDWPDQFVCAHCSMPARGLLEHHADARALAGTRMVDVSPAEAFAALHGLGLPEERACTREVVDNVLLGRPVRGVAGREIPGTGRFCIEHLELGCGTRLYLGASSEGAIVYRITRPISYAERVLEQVASPEEGEGDTDVGS